MRPGTDQRLSMPRTLRAVRAHEEELSMPLDQRLKAAMLADPAPDSPAWCRCKSEIAYLVCRQLGMPVKRVPGIPRNDDELWFHLHAWLLSEHPDGMPESVRANISLAYLATDKAMKKIREYLAGQHDDRSFEGWCRRTIRSVLSDLRKSKSPQAWRVTPILPAEGSSDEPDRSAVYAEELGSPTPTPPTYWAHAEDRTNLQSLIRDAERLWFEIASQKPEAVRAAIEAQLGAAFTAYNTEQQAMTLPEACCLLRKSEPQPRVTRAALARRHGTTEQALNTGVSDWYREIEDRFKHDPRHVAFTARYVHEPPAPRGRGALPALIPAACAYLESKIAEFGSDPPFGMPKYKPKRAREWFLWRWVCQSRRGKKLNLRISINAAVRRCGGSARSAGKSSPTSPRPSPTSTSGSQMAGSGDRRRG